MILVFIVLALGVAIYIAVGCYVNYTNEQPEDQISDPWTSYRKEHFKDERVNEINNLLRTKDHCRSVAVDSVADCICHLESKVGGMTLEDFYYTFTSSEFSTKSFPTNAPQMPVYCGLDRS